jgi:hypothetical protein
MIDILKLVKIDQMFKITSEFLVYSAHFLSALEHILSINGIQRVGSVTVLIF